MHDFLLAKEIVDQLKEIATQRHPGKIKKVKIEIGQVALSHDGHPEHIEDVSEENLRFGLESIVKGTFLEKTEFDIRKIAGENWKITDIEI